jgi:hypothetical protein
MYFTAVAALQCLSSLDLLSHPRLKEINVMANLQENPRSASVTLMKCKKKYCEIRVADLYGLTIKLA